jgi:hypothetical protein
MVAQRRVFRHGVKVARNVTSSSSLRAATHMIAQKRRDEREWRTSGEMDVSKTSRNG